MAAAPASGSTITEYTLPNAGLKQPEAITAGPDGNVWFAEYDAGTIGRITPAGDITEFPVTTGSGDFLQGITTGPDGNLWFTRFQPNRIDRITPAGAVTPFALDAAIGEPNGITKASDGNLWFAATNAVGKITPAGVVTPFALASGHDAVDIVQGPDGAMWFTDAAGAIGRLPLTATSGADITEFTLAGTSPHPQAITTGPDGSGGRALWITVEGTAMKVARFPASATSSAAVTEFPMPTGTQEVRDLTEGPDGFMYVTLRLANPNSEIARVAPATGIDADYPLPPDSSRPRGITLGPDGNLWFTNASQDRIGRLTPGGPFGTAPPGISGVPAPGQTLACSPASWAYSPTSITRQLVRGLSPSSYTPIPGTAVSPPATASYTVQSGDVGLQIACEENASNASGTGTIRSGPRTVAAGVPVNTRPPAVTGSALVGNVLTCDTGDWTNSPLTFDITWLRGGTPIANENHNQYLVQTADDHARVSCAVQGRNDVGAGSSVESNRLLAVSRPPVNTVRPVLVLDTTGPRPTDKRATCNPGTWSDDYGDYAFEILRDGQPILAGSSYDVTVDDLGHTLACTVVSRNPAGASDKATSADTLVPLPPVDPAAGQAVVFSAGGLGPLDPVNLDAATEGLTSVLKDQAVARMQTALDTFLAKCPAARAHAAQDKIVDPREIAKAEERRKALCALLRATPKERIQVGADGVRIIPTGDGQCVLGTNDPCAPLPIPITDFVTPALDPLTRQQNTPVRVLWDFNSDGRVDADCDGASPILHTLPDRGVYNVHAVIVLPDSQRLGQYPSTIVSLAYHPTTEQIRAAGPKLIPALQYYANQGIYQLSPAGRRDAQRRGWGTAVPRQVTGNQAQLGTLRSAQPMACKTQLLPPEDPDLPCVNDGYIGQMHVTGNLCPITERRIPAAEYDQLPKALQDALHAKAIADFANDGQQRRRRRRSVPTFPRTPFDAQALALTQLASPTPVRFSVPADVSRIAAAMNVPPAKAVFALDQIYTAKGAMKLNGADVLPSAKAATLLIPSDAGGWTDAVKSMDLVSSAADLQLDGIPLTPEAGKAVFKKLADGAKAGASDFANVQLDALKRKLDSLKLGPFSLAGNMDVKLKDGVAIITAKAELNLLKIGPGGSPMRTDVTLRATPAGKISLQTVHLSTAAAYLGFLKLRNLDLTYDPSDSGLTVKGQILFPPLDAGVDIIEFNIDRSGRFKTFDAKLELGRGQGIPIGPGVYITALHAGTHNSLERIVGGATISAGPSATGAGCPAVGVEGTFTFDFPPPFTADVNADALIGCFKVGNAHLLATSDGYIQIDAHAHLDLGVIQMGADIGGSLLLPNWQIEAAGDGTIVDLIDGHLNAVISNRGIAACGTINIEPLGVHLGSVSGGMAVKFPGGVPPLNPVAALSQLSFFEGCDLGRWTPLPSLFTHRQAGDSARSFEMPTSGRGAGIRIDGAGGAPKVRLVGPDGQVIDLSSGSNPIKGNGYLAVRSDHESRTIVLLGEPKGGRWQVEPVEGSVPITGLETSPVLPRPVIKAAVGGVGASRILRYRVTPIEGQVVRFVEQADGGARVLGSVKGGGRGTLRYRTAEARGTARRVIAQVQQDGLPRTSIVVARYRAPNPRAGRPTGVRVRRRGARATITWNSAPYAVRYEVTVRTGDGGRLLLVPRGRRRSVVVTGLSRREGFLAQVRGYSPAGRPGPAAKVRGRGSLLIGTKPRRPRHS